MWVSERVSRLPHPLPLPRQQEGRKTPSLCAVCPPTEGEAVRVCVQAFWRYLDRAAGLGFPVRPRVKQLLPATIHTINNCPDILS